MKTANLHKTDKGKEIIKNLYYQMNNNRLSTNSLKKNIDRVKLHSEMKSFLTQSVKKGSIELWIYIPETDYTELFMSFPSVYSCAKYLNVTRYTINQSLKK